MRLSALAALMIVTTVVLSACAQDQMAALEDQSNTFFGRGEAPRQTFVPPNTILTDGKPLQPRMVNHATSEVAALDPIAVGDLPQPTTPAAPPMKASAPVATSSSVMAVNNAAWQWPVKGKLIEDFQTQREGITIASPKGTPIRAAQEGDVAYVGTQVNHYGNLVIIRHSNGEMSSYAHAKEIIVSKGDHIRQGDVLGYVGQTGRASEPQLHFAIRSGDRTIDPMTRLPQMVASY